MEIQEKALISTHKKDMPYYKDGTTNLEGY